MNRLLATISVLVVSSALGACQRRSESVAFQVNFDSAKAPIGEQWSLTIDDGHMGLPSSAALCGDTLFLADPQAGVIHAFSLSKGNRTRTFQAVVPGGPARSAPESLAADCAGNRLLVVEKDAILEIDAASGQVGRRHPRQRSIGPALGTALFIDNSVVVPTFVNADGWLTRPPTEAFSGAALGYRQPLDGQAGASLFPVLTAACRSMSFDCLRIGIDRGPSPESPWIVCQSGGTEVAVYGSTGTLQHRFSVASPLFRNDGDTVAPGSQIPEKIKWSQRNSSIYACYLFGSHVVTIHTILLDGDWQPGKAMEPAVFLNVHGLDGTPILADARLDDLPLMRDATSILVGVMQHARVPGGAASFRLQRVAVADAKMNLLPWTKVLGAS